MREERRRKALRLPQHDYGQEGGYFITICTIHRKWVLSSVGAGRPPGLAHREQILSSVGAGHLAGPVVELTEIGALVDSLIQEIPQMYPTVQVEKYVVMPNHVHLLLKISEMGPAGCPAPTIPKIIGALKSISTRKAGQAIWQRGYYDHIIRDEADYLRIWDYIDTNPAKWEEDEYYAP